MNPSNRRTGKPKLPPHLVVSDDELFDPSEPELEAPAPPVAESRARGSAGPEPKDAIPPKPRSARLVRAMAVLQTVLGAALVLGVAIGVAWAARRYVRESPRFALRSVEVSGGRHRKNDEIVAKAGLAVGTNLFSIELEEARARLATDPWIESARLSRRLPGTISVEVTEREAAALVVVGDTTYLATRRGDIFKRLELGDPVDLPIVSGLTPEAVAEDREGVVNEVRKALDLAAEYAESSLGTKAPLQQVHVGDDGALTLVVGKGGLSLLLGKAPFRRKIEQAGRVAMELERRLGPRALTEKTDGIMLDSEAHPERIVVRMR